MRILCNFIFFNYKRIYIAHCLRVKFLKIKLKFNILKTFSNSQPKKDCLMLGYGKKGQTFLGIEYYHHNFWWNCRSNKKIFPSQKNPKWITWICNWYKAKAKINKGSITHAFLNYFRIDFLKIHWHWILCSNFFLQLPPPNARSFSKFFSVYCYLST